MCSFGLDILKTVTPYVKTALTDHDALFGKIWQLFLQPPGHAVGLLKMGDWWCPLKKKCSTTMIVVLIKTRTVPQIKNCQLS